MDSDNGEEAPLGCLTQTLIRSPLVQWIGPAHIRHAELNDVVFVSSDRVQIKHLERDYSLIDVVSKTNFGSRICCSRVFGLQREPTPGDLSAIIKSEPTTDGPFTHDDKLQSNHDDQLDFASAPKALRHLAPHILILVLENHTVAFLYSLSGLADHVELLLSFVPVPRSLTVREQLTARLAVDPRSNAFALAATEGWLRLFKLKSHEQLEAQIQNGMELEPVSCERTIKVDGIISQMEFLQPPTSDPHAVTLMIILVKNGRGKLIWFEWHAADDLEATVLHPKCQPLPSSKPLPTLLIPLSGLGNVMAIYQNSAILFRNILTGTPTSVKCSLDIPSDPLQMTSSKFAPRWTDWARSLKKLGKPPPSDSVYLYREDGLVTYVRVKQDQLAVDSCSGMIDSGLDQAFAVLDNGPLAHDLIVASGYAGNGGAWIFDPDDSRNPLQLEYYTPTIPTVDSLMLSTRIDAETREHCRYFTCSGHANRGLVTENRRAVSYKPFFEPTEFDMTMFAGITGISALWQHGSLIILLSSNDQTFPIRQEPGMEPELLDHLAGIELEAPTLAAASLSDGMLLQITRRNMSVAPGQDGPRISVDKHSNIIQDEHVSVAACDVHGGEILFGLVRGDSEQNLLIGGVSQTDRWTSAESPLESAVTCIAVTSIRNKVLTAIADIDGRLCIHETHSESLVAPRLMASYAFRIIPFEICDSVAIESPTPRLDHLIVLCALRDGHLAAFSLKLGRRGDAGGVVDSTLVLRQQLALAPASFRIVTNPTKSGHFLCHSQARSFSITFQDGMFSKPDIRSVRVSNTDLSSRILALTTLQYIKVDGRYSSICVQLEQGGLQILDLSSGDESYVLKSWKIQGMPSRMIFSKSLKRLLVLSNKLDEARKPQPQSIFLRAGRREAKPVLTVLCPYKRHDTDHAYEVGEGRQNPESSQEEQLKLEHVPGERYLGLCEWFIPCIGRRYHILAFNTLVQETACKTSGRILLYSISIDDSSDSRPSRFRVKHKKMIDLSAPVSSMVPTPDGSALIYGSGSDLVKLSLDTGSDDRSSGLRFAKPIKTDVRSMIRHISCLDDSDRICITTASESFQVFENSSDQLRHVSGDVMARPGLSHIRVFSHDAFMLSDMSGALRILKLPQTLRINKSADVVLEAHVPHPIVRFARMHSPSTWDVFVPRRGIFTLDPATEGFSLPAGLEPWTPSTAECKTQDLRPDSAYLGACPDGTAYQIQFVTGPPLHLLKFVEDLCKRDTTINPWSKIETRTEKFPQVYGSACPQGVHVDGDLLHQLVTLGHIHLMSMIDGAVDARYGNFSTSSSRPEQDQWAVLRRLVQKVFGTAMTAEDLHDKEMLTETVCSWIEFTMQSRL